MPEVKISRLGVSAVMPSRSLRGGAWRGALATSAAKPASASARSSSEAGFSASGTSHSGTLGRSSVAAKLARHSSPASTARAPVLSRAWASGLPLTWVLSGATTTPSLTRPNQAKKNSGRFSRASAQTSPALRPRARAACATWLARASTSA
ncbi:hypothetical protein D3C86_1791380 [compost metagenome]